MNKIMLALAIACVATNELPAQTSVDIAGGAAVPFGTLGDISDIGYNVSAGLNFGGTLLPVGLRFEGSYNGLGRKGGAGDVRIINGTANAVFNVTTTRDAPYLIAGLGAYSRSISIGSLGYGSSRTVLGINAGGGLRFPLSGLSTFFEARYHLMLGNAADATNYQFVPITFGIMF